jgi:hypothetical protein
MLVIPAELPVAVADADPLPLLLPELHAAVSVAKEMALMTMRARRPARLCLMTLLISMISCATGALADCSRMRYPAPVYWVIHE